MTRSERPPESDDTRPADGEDDRARLGREKLTDSDVDKLYDLLEAATGILELHGIRYTIEGGTLLGAVRNGGLIQHDNDADLDVLHSDLGRILELRHVFEAYHLELIETPGWGLQVAHLDSPCLEPGLWTDGESRWTSRWPFLDFIAIAWVEGQATRPAGYYLAQSVARHDYPDYHLTGSDWSEPFDRIAFGHLRPWAIGTEKARRAYLDRSYADWGEKISMNMDHRANRYFDTPIELAIEAADQGHRPRSDAPTTLARPWSSGR